MHKYLQKLTATLAIAMGLIVILSPGIVLAAPSESTKAVCEGVGLAGGGTGCADPAGPTVQTSVAAVVNILSLVVGIAAVIMVIVGGFKYIISSGDSSNIKSAKDTVLFAIIGLIIVALAQVIVRFVLRKFTV